MTIKRIINGKEIEIKLTEREMWDIYREQEHKFDMEDVRGYIEDIDWEDGERPPEMSDDQIDEAAFWMREWIDSNDVVGDIRWDCIRDAIEKVTKDE